MLRPTCSACGYVYYRDPKVAVGVLAGLDGRVLLARRNHEPGMGLWTFPSGYVDAGEVVEAAARREAMEETGAEVRLERLMAVRSQEGSPVVLIVYAAVITGGYHCARPGGHGSGSVRPGGAARPGLPA